MEKNKFVRLLSLIVKAYNEGRLIEAEKELKSLQQSEAENIARLFILDAILGWIFWKAKKRMEAVKLWNAISGSTLANSSAKMFADAGLAVYYAEEKMEDEADAAISEIKASFCAFENSLMTVIILNSLLKALADLGRYDEAKEVFNRGAEISESLEKYPDSEITRRAKHQRAKLGFNFATRLLIPNGDYDKAERELCDEVANRYLEAVGENNDLAACYHWIGVVLLKKGEEKKALKIEVASWKIWNRLRQDFPNRDKAASSNIWDICELMKLSPEKYLERLFDRNGSTLSVADIKAIKKRKEN